VADDFFVVAEVLAPHGLRGELKCRVVTDFPERFARGARFLLQRGAEPPRPVVLRGARPIGQHLLLRFDQLPDRTAAEAWRGADVLVPADQAVELPPGQFFWRDLIGLRLEDRDGTHLGRVDEVLRTGANDVYVAHGPLGEVLVPATKEVVKEIDPARGRIVIEPLPGLLPDQPQPRPRRRKP
jgi:16S rRNA processing protein RimM